MGIGAQVYFLGDELGVVVYPVRSDNPEGRSGYPPGQNQEFPDPHSVFSSIFIYIQPHYIKGKEN
jgi:hypothetical protein